jgi:hypothetical protein
MAEIRSAAEGARGRALISGTRSVSDRGGESALTERGPAPEGKQTATRVRGGPSRSIKIERGGVRGGPNWSEGVRTGPSRSIKIRRGKIRPGRMSGCEWR